MELYWRKLICFLVGYNVWSIERNSVGATCFERLDSKTFQISLTAANLFVSHSCFFFCQNKCGLWGIWNKFSTLLYQKENNCHLRIVYQSYEDLLQAFLWSTSIQVTHQFQLCLLFWPMCTCLIYWSYHFPANVL